MVQPLNNQTHSIEILGQDRASLDQAADLLANAFMYGNPDPADPSNLEKGLPDPFYNRRHLGDLKVRDLFRTIIDLASKKGHTIAVVRDAQSKISGAMWLKGRDVRDMNILAFPKLIGPAFRAFGFIGALWYTWDVIRHIPEYSVDTTYLSMLGVARSSQGKGVGRALIEYAITSAKGQAVVLSTMNSKNIKTYENRGFVLVPNKQTKSSDSSHRPGFTTFHMSYPANNIDKSE